MTPLSGNTADDARDILAGGPPGAPLVVYACSTGDFTRRYRCLGESFLFMDGGPVAMIGASIDSHPVPNAYSGVEFLKQLGEQQKRLGDIWLTTQRSALDAYDPLMDYLISLSDRTEARMDVARLKLDHVLMHNILGDPATRLRLPDALPGTVESTFGGWQWRVEESTDRGEAQLTAGLRATSIRFTSVSPGVTDDEANRLLTEANAQYLFSPQPSPEPGAAWEGSITEPGILRLVATGPGVFGIATFDLKRGIFGCYRPSPGVFGKSEVFGDYGSGPGLFGLEIEPESEIAP